MRDQNQEHQQQQQPPTVKLTSKNHRTLPILDYYLTFIHYFGFGINPADDNRSRYLSIRVKRQSQQQRQQQQQQQQQKRVPLSADFGGRTSVAPDGGGQDQQQWLASYTRRAQSKMQTSSRNKLSLFVYLKTTMKYMAITFNTFIATNHCIVLVDSICSGSRGIEDIILDIRLVITKLSALIFVLSWHHKRHEVRQLIKLVKSTSLYILATHGHQHLPLATSHSPGNKHHHHHHQVARQRDLSLLAPESPIPSPTVMTAAAAAGAATYTSESGKEPKTTTTTTDNNESPIVEVSDEIGSSLRLDTSAFDRRILKGWFACLLIIIVHFSLSEAEISKSYHLWQWLDDYSLHQLNNQSISYETLMFLASFDNYIYTVHVYGTRLIGASIICIVCSLQHEVIKSLNLYTLRLVQRSQQPLLVNAVSIAEAGNSDVSTVAAAAAGRGIISGKAVPSDGRQYGINRRSTVSSSSSSSSSSSTVGSENSLLSRANSIDQQQLQLDDDHLNSNSFFVLGESDWFDVRDYRAKLKPRGHLTKFIWQTWNPPKQYLYALVSLGSRVARKMYQLILRDPSVWKHRQQRDQREQELHTTVLPAHLRAGCPAHGRVTPRNAPTTNNNNNGYIATFFHLASSLIAISQHSAATTRGSNNNNDNKELYHNQPTTNHCFPPTSVDRKFAFTSATTTTTTAAARIRPTPLKLSVTSQERIHVGGVDYDDDDPMMTRSIQQHAIDRATTTNRMQMFTTTTNKLLPDDDRYWMHDIGKFGSASSALCWSKPLRSSDDYHSRLISMVSGQLNHHPTVQQCHRLPVPPSPLFLQQQQQQRQQQQLSPLSSHSQPINQWTALGARKIELQLERLSTKYELVRTVMSRIDSCFGPMLLIQFFFLFLMSCIDLVYFSLCFSPNTKTKWIIISGMILLWCPYMLIYKFASDMGSSSKELLVSIRRLARLYLLEDQAFMATDQLINDSLKDINSGQSNNLWDHLGEKSEHRFFDSGDHLLASSLSTNTRHHQRIFPPDPARTTQTAFNGAINHHHHHQQRAALAAGGTKIGAGIVDKLDQIFKPTHLSIMGIMTVDKFFLLNFAKIVITSSVMMIQFISN